MIEVEVVEVEGKKLRVRFMRMKEGMLVGVFRIGRYKDLWIDEENEEISVFDGLEVVEWKLSFEEFIEVMKREGKRIEG